MSQPATQCVTPLLENDTQKKMLLGTRAESQLCSHGPQCNRNHPGCGATMSNIVSLSGAETKSVEDIYNENLKKDLQISALTHYG